MARPPTITVSADEVRERVPALSIIALIVLTLLFIVPFFFYHHVWASSNEILRFVWPVTLSVKTAYERALYSRLLTNLFTRWQRLHVRAGARRRLILPVKG